MRSNFVRFPAGRFHACRLFLAALWLTLLGWAVGLAPGPALAEGRVALVIGNAGYRHTRVLPNPRNDAEAIAAMLRRIGFADVTFRLDLDYKAMREEVRTFASKAAGSDVAIVYYAGHGIEVGGENYLVPVDARLARDRDLEYEAVTLASVLDAVSEARKLKLVILDACRDNPLSHKISLRTGIARKVTRGLERFEPVGDVLVAYAAKAGTVALDGAGKHSPFAEALLKHMPTPGIDVFRLFGKVSEAVLDATNRQQEPWLYGRPSGEAVALVPLPTIELPPAPPGVPPSTGGLSATEAARICRDVAGMTSLSVLRVLSEQHKGSPTGACVAARIDELTKAEWKPEPETPRNAPVTECDRLAATPGYVPGVGGVALAQLDAARAVPACRDAVAKHPGEARLEAWLGRSLQRAGLPAEARQWYEKAAEKGHAVALNNLGGMYFRGEAVPQAFATARSLFEKAAEKGEPAAMHNLGMVFRDGKGAPGDFATARVWFEKAAEKGLAAAMTDLGWLYQRGYGVAVDLTAARGWYERAAAGGHALGMARLGALYYNGQGVARDYVLARSWYEKAAEKGIASAMADLGFLYYNGHGVARDYVLAHSWHQKAAEKGEPSAMYSLGVLFREGKGVPQNLATARIWFEKAAEKGVAQAMTDLGWLYHRGYGVAVDFAAARGWYERAAARGHALGMARLGLLYYNGQGVARDYVLARRWLEKAAEKGEPSAMYGLGVLFREGKGVPQDFATARTWLEKATEKGVASAMTDLGFLYHHGQGVARDYAVARMWYEKAAEKGEPTAMYNLGLVFRDGTGVRRDFAAARAWLEKAAEKGMAPAMTAIGELYHLGLGVARNNVLARSWLEKGAERGDATALHQLAVLHSSGRGVPANPQLAARHLLEAARRGSQRARQELDGRMTSWPSATRAALQALLTATGDHRGRRDGVWDKASRDAARAYYSRPS